MPDETFPTTLIDPSAPNNPQFLDLFGFANVLNQARLAASLRILE